MFNILVKTSLFPKAYVRVTNCEQILYFKSIQDAEELINDLIKDNIYAEKFKDAKIVIANDIYEEN